MSDEPRDQRDKTSLFLTLYSECQSRIYYHILMFCPDVNEADEVLSDVNLTLWEKFDHFSPGSNFLAWAREIARRQLMIRHRSKFRDTLLLSPDVMELIAEATDDVPTEYDRRKVAALQGCVAKLSEPDRALIQQRYAPEASVQQLAAELGRTPNALSQALGRIRRALQRCIEKSLRTETEDLA